mmetsp:Transcript_69759/g.202218  ORF Transcript_69759/g.202218 Transcript_69759/m.202218 type:complete len:242 (-) Transcript_69759:55-780(-)
MHLYSPGSRQSTGIQNMPQIFFAHVSHANLPSGATVLFRTHNSPEAHTYALSTEAAATAGAATATVLVRLAAERFVGLRPAAAAFPDATLFLVLALVPVTAKTSVATFGGSFSWATVATFGGSFNWATVVVVLSSPVEAIVSLSLLLANNPSLSVSPSPSLCSMAGALAGALVRALAGDLARLRVGAFGARPRAFARVVVLGTRDLVFGPLFPAIASVPFPPLAVVLAGEFFFVAGRDVGL